MNDVNKYIKRVEKRFNKNKPKCLLYHSQTTNKPNELLIHSLIKEMLKDVTDIEIVELGGRKQNEYKNDKSTN